MDSSSLKLEPQTPEETPRQIVSASDVAKPTREPTAATTTAFLTEFGLDAASAEEYAKELQSDGYDFVALFRSLSQDGLLEHLTQWGWDSAAVTKAMQAKQKATQKKTAAKRGGRSSRRGRQSPRAGAGSPSRITQRLYDDHSERQQSRKARQAAHIKKQDAELRSTPVLNEQSRQLASHSRQSGPVYDRLHSLHGSPRSGRKKKPVTPRRAPSPMSGDRQLVRLQREVRELREFKASAEDKVAQGGKQNQQQLDEEVVAHMLTKAALEQSNAAARRYQDEVRERDEQKTAAEAAAKQLEQEKLEEQQAEDEKAQQEEKELQSEKDSRLEMISELRLFKSLVEDKLGEHDAVERIEALLALEVNANSGEVQEGVPPPPASSQGSAPVAAPAPAEAEAATAGPAAAEAQPEPADQPGEIEATDTCDESEADAESTAGSVASLADVSSPEPNPEPEVAIFQISNDGFCIKNDGFCI